MTTTACSGCGVELAPQNVLYTTEALVVCAKCYAAADIVATDKRAANNIRNAAMGSLIGGVLAFFAPLSGMMIVVIAMVVFTIVSGIYAIQSLARGNERFTKHLSPATRVFIWIGSIVGIAIAGFIGLAVLGFGAVFL